MKRILWICLAVLCLNGVCFAEEPPSQNGTTKEALHVYLLGDIPQPITITPELTVTMKSFITQVVPYNIDKEAAYNYFFYKSKSWYGGVTYYFKEIIGFTLSFTNSSDKFYNIQWSGSNLSFGNFTGMPFLPGMKYIDAGKPNEIPDTLLPPKTRKTMEIYTSDVEFDYNEWTHNGQLIPVDNSMQLILYLKINCDNVSTYYPVKFPHIGY